MFSKLNVPPIKSQGIKTKLVPWIKSIVPLDFDGRWVEPFMGTGVIGFNIIPNQALMCDTNPHLVRFYTAIKNKELTPEKVKSFLHKESLLLSEKGEKHYYAIRERFNIYHQPLDFLFINRAGFNGMIRFNQKGESNVPFCKKPNRFSQSYITKIVNQVRYLAWLFLVKDFVFKCQPFQKTISQASEKDIIYCDPPYIDRHVDYYNGWGKACEIELFSTLSKTPSRFILSTWHHNDYRANEYINLLWNKYNILTKKHFYHIGGSEDNRNTMIEAIVTNYPIKAFEFRENEKQNQISFV